MHEQTHRDEVAGRHQHFFVGGEHAPLQLARLLDLFDGQLRRSLSRQNRRVRLGRRCVQIFDDLVGVETSLCAEGIDAGLDHGADLTFEFVVAGVRVVTASHTGQEVDILLKLLQLLD